MEVRRNGRYTAHDVHLDITRPVAFSNDATKGKIWPNKIIISYQYLWSTGTWHVVKVEILGRRNRTAQTSEVRITLRKPENWPVWLEAHVTEHTPVALSEPEMAS
jgi:hypothetical protein